MYCVVYEFTVAVENAEKFQSAWRELTLYFKNNCESSGSRLHRVIDDETKWVAYAQWPSTDAYEQDIPDANLAVTRQAFLSAILNIQIVYQMTVADDLLDVRDCGI